MWVVTKEATSTRSVVGAVQQAGYRTTEVVAPDQSYGYSSSGCSSSVSAEAGAGVMVEVGEEARVEAA